MAALRVCPITSRRGARWIEGEERYLALELSPAFEGDRLNVIELDRSAIGQTTSRWDLKLFVADRAIAA